MAFEIFTHLIDGSLTSSQPSITTRSISALNVLKDRDTNVPFGNRNFATKTRVEDPFVAKPASASQTSPRKLSIFSSPSSETKPGTLMFSRFSLPPPDSSKSIIESEKEHKIPNALGQNYSLPSPPETPESSLQQSQEEDGNNEFHPTPTKSSEDKAVQRRSVIMTTTSTTTITAETAFSVNTGAEDGMGSSETDTKPMEAPSSAKPKPLFGSTSLGQKPLPGFDFAFASNISRLSKIPREDQPGQHNTTPNADGTSSLKDYKIPSKSFDFEAPTDLSFAMRLPEKPSTIWDDFNPQVGFGKVNSTRRKEDSIQSTLKPTASPETPTKTSAIMTSSSRRSEALVIETEEPFGYAIVTPEAARYKTYLPAQQNHGLPTPPDTPETLPRLEINTGPFKDSFSGFAVRPVVTRKPLPNLEEKDGNVVAGEVGPFRSLCTKCQDRVCRCHETIEDEEVRVGRFHSLGLRQLKKKVVRKMKTLKMRISRTSVKRDES
jgi:hypothetical protein